MQVSAVILARVILFVDSADLNPRGTAYYPEIAKALIERYGFQKFPQKFEDWDESKGVTFELGRVESTTIDKLIIFSNGLQLDTSSSTKDSEAILEEALNWASKTLGLRFRRDMIQRKGYVSQFSFFSDAPLLQLNPIFKTVSAKVARGASESLRVPAVYEPTGIVFSLDPAEQRIPMHPFTIERKQGVAFADKKYFSAAPLPTDTHLSLVEEFEKSILSQKPN